jgi:hypothetical protein
LSNHTKSVAQRLLEVLEDGHSYLLSQVLYQLIDEFSSEEIINEIDRVKRYGEAYSREPLRISITDKGHKRLEEFRRSRSAPHPTPPKPAT